MDNIYKKKHVCSLCNYTTNLKSHYDKHLQTKKHKKLIKKNIYIKNKLINIIV